MNQTLGPREFWNRAILRWESDRYGTASDGSNALERLAKRFSGLEARLANARRVILPNVRGKKVVELGCGSGLLAEEVIAAGAVSYLGFDIADRAIHAAQERVREEGLSDRIRFAAADVSSVPPLDADLVFSLGFLDWLSPADIARVFSLGGSAEFLHSFSEQRVSFWRYVHKGYIWLSGHSSGSYRGQYHTVPQLLDFAGRRGDLRIRVFRDSAMRFGTFLTTLPLPR